MALILADRVLETALAPGTSTVALLGAASGFQSFFTGIGASNTTYYVISDVTGSNWEVGLGTLDATGLVLTRTTVLSSSNSGALVNFTGSVNVSATYPAENATLRSTVAGTAFSGTNVTGTLNTSGLSLSIAPQTAYVFSNSNNVSFGIAGSTVTASASYPTQTQQPMAYSAANGSNTANTLIFANSNGVSFSTGTQGLYATVATNYQSQGAYLTTAMQSNASSDFAGTGTTFAGTNISGSMTMNTAGLNLALSAAAGGGGGAVTISDWTPYQLAASSTTSFAQNTVHFAHLLPQAYVAATAMELLWSFSHSSTSNVAWTNARTLSYGLYKENTVGGGTAMSLMFSSSFAIILSASSNLSMGLTMSQGTNSQTYSTAASAISAFNQNQWKIMSLPFATTLNPGNSPYYFGYVMSTATTGANVNLTHQYMMNNEQSNASNGAWAVTGFTASNKSIIQEPYGFIYSTTSGGLAASYAYTDMSINSNTQPYMYLEA